LLSALIISSLLIANRFLNAAKRPGIFFVAGSLARGSDSAGLTFARGNRNRFP
jgi:hypothetical protein